MNICESKNKYILLYEGHSINKGIFFLTEEGHIIYTSHSVYTKNLKKKEK